MREAAERVLKYTIPKETPLLDDARALATAAPALLAELAAGKERIASLTDDREVLKGHAATLTAEIAAARAEIDRLCGPICPLDGKRAIEHRHGAEWCLTWHHAYRDNGGRCAAKKHIPGARGYVCRKPEAAYLHQPCEHPHSWPEGMAWKRAYQTIGGAFAAEATTEERT